MAQKHMRATLEEILEAAGVQRRESDRYGEGGGQEYLAESDSESEVYNYSGIDTGYARVGG